MKKPNKQEHPEMYLFTYSDMLYIIYPDKRIDRCNYYNEWKEGSSYTTRQIRYGKDFTFVGEIK